MMKTFVYLCSETVVAEFPVIDICSAFRIFDLSVKGRDRGAETAEHLPDTRDCTARLCQAFDVPLEPLLQEFWDHRRIAMHHAISHDWFFCCLEGGSLQDKCQEWNCRPSSIRPSS